MINAKDMKVNK